MNKKIKLALFISLILLLSMSLFGCSNGATTKKIMTDADIEKNFKMERVANGYSIKEYIGVGENVNIPTKYKGYPINRISEGAFMFKKYIEKVNIPNSVEEIQSHAFNQCTNLREVAFGNGIKIIGTNAFYYCENLKTITLNQGLEKIGAAAFCGTSISEIIIPSSVKSIEGEAFYNCESLQRINCQFSRSYLNNNKKSFKGLFRFYKDYDDEWHEEIDRRVNFI